MKAAEAASPAEREALLFERDAAEEDEKAKVLEMKANKVEWPEQKQGLCDAATYRRNAAEAWREAARKARHGANGGVLTSKSAAEAAELLAKSTAEKAELEVRELDRIYSYP